MNKMEMIQQMAKEIQKNPELSVSTWQGTFRFEAGAPVFKELKDLNEIYIEGMPELPEDQMTAIEMLLASMANCYATTLHMLAYGAKIPLNKTEIIVTGDFDRSPFLGLSDGNPGLMNPKLELSVASSVEQEAVIAIAEKALKQSPVLSSLGEELQLIVH